MEITAISSSNRVPQLPNPLSQSEIKTSENITTNHVNESNNTSLQLSKPATTPEKTASANNDSTSLNSNTGNDNDSSSTILAALSKVSSSSKLARFKTSDKLTKAIETCKKLQIKLSDQNALKAKDDKAVSAIPTPLARTLVAVNGESTENALPPSQELTICVPRLPDEVSVLSENESRLSSSSNSSSVPQCISEWGSTSSPNSSETSLKRFLFLFRPSDHEVLVRNKGVNMYRCNVCGGMYRQKFSLKRHFLRTHINFQYISKSDVSNCKIAVPSEFNPVERDPSAQKAKKKFKSSNAIFFENNETRVMPGLYTCHVCVGVKFDMEHELGEHYSMHSDAERKTFHCDKCNASFFKKQILSRHLASHGEKLVKKECRRCGSEFATKADYQKHMISHSSGRVCKYCSKILSTSANRKRHEALHLGLKPYRCTHCGMCFAQSKDLDRHLRKQHRDVCHFCDKCNKLFPSQASLKVHVYEKHSDHSPKKAENSSSPQQQVNRASASKPEPIKVTLPIKLKVCMVCKRSFATFYAMMKHRTQAHPYYTKRRRNRKTMKQKAAQQAASHEAVRKTYGKASKATTFTASPARRGRPPLDKTVRFGTPNYRPGSRWMSKRERELAKKEELEFYFSLSEKIAENLLHYVDGKTSQLSLKAYNFNDHHTPYNFEERGRFPWSNYNFPAGYDVELALSTRGQEVKAPENLSHREKCLYATGLSSVQKLSQMGQRASNSMQLESNKSISETVRIQLNGIDMKKLNIEERKKLIGKKVNVVCLCCVCGQKFESSEAFQEHSLNNHVNVDCPCIEIEGELEEDPEVPEDLCRQHLSAKGMFFSCNVPPSLSEANILKCTKCKSDFKTYLELHSHIVRCGNLRSSPTHIWKIRKHKRIKRTMKNRMNSTEQQAAVDSHNMGSEKDLSEKKDKSATTPTDKIPKPAEKSQFYKSGRLQTTSFTVDMNYFKTKPMKPPNTQPSKRGRKSYATLSYRYKNASVPSATNQCCHCKETFLSPSALNIHLQSHIPAQLKRSKQSGYSSDSSVKSANSDSGVQNKGVGVRSCQPSSPAEAVNLSLAKPKPLQNSSKPENLLKTFPLPYATVAKAPLFCINKNISVSPQKLLHNANDSVLMNNKQVQNRVVTNSQSSLEKPVDLSRNFNASNINNSSSSQNSSSASSKTALEIAMAAVQEFSDNLEQNEHITNLQRTVEKLTPPSKPVPIEVKSVSPRKLGRPKKVKNFSPDKSKKNLFPEAVVNSIVTIAKPMSKLEETVKRLAESKAKNDPNLNKEVISPSKVVQISLSAKTLQNPVASVSSAQTANSPYQKEVKKVSLPAPPAFVPKTNITVSSSTKFMPILIYSTPNKPVSILGLTPNLKNTSTSASPNVLKPISSNSVSVSVPKNADKTGPEQSSISENVTEKSQGNNAKPSSPEKRSEEAGHLSSSQGRISPSLESIVNSIKQKLHSQDSSPHDDVAISWLEDEKFEIPSLPKLAVPAPVSQQPLTSQVPNSSQSKIVIDTDSEAPSSIKTPQKSQNSPSIAVETSTVDETNTVDETSTLEETSTVDETLKDHKDEPSSGVKGSHADKIEVLQLNSEGNVHIESIQIEVAKDASDNKPKGTKKVIKHRKKKHQLFTVRKNRSANLKAQNKNTTPVERKPGRPRKNAASPNSDAFQSKVVKRDQPQLEIKENVVKLHDTANVVNNDVHESVSVDKVEDSNKHHLQFKEKDGIPNQNISLLDASLKNPAKENLNHSSLENLKSKSEATKEINESSFAVNVSNVKKAQKTAPRLETTDPNLGPQISISIPANGKDLQLDDIIADPKIANLQPSLTLPDSSITDSSDAKDMQQKHCDPKTIHSQPSEAKQNNPVSSLLTGTETTITTEFGRSLASRMKEKMRQSFENASLESIIKSDECNNAERTLEPPFSDTSSFVSDDDSEYLRAIKKEIDFSEPTKKHSCPFCMLEFAYLTNFRRHLRVCRSRLLRKEIEPIQNNTSPLLQYLPKKDEVEHSMLNLLRHQSRQTQMLNEAEKTTGNKVDNKFRTYSCNVCHRIYLSLFKLLQHQVTHKLSNLDQSSDLDCSKENESYSVSDLEEKNLQDLEVKNLQDLEEKNLQDLEEKNLQDFEVSKSTEQNCAELNLTEGSLNKDVPEEKDALPDKTLEKVDKPVPSSIAMNSVSESSEILDQSVHADPDVSGEKSDETKAEQPINQEPLKRKRGRPLGWRKSLHGIPNPVIKKPTRKFQDRVKTKSVLLRKKIGSSNVLKHRGKRLLYSKAVTSLNKTALKGKYKPALKQFEFTADDDLPSDTALQKGTDSELDFKAPVRNKEKPKKFFKISLKKKLQAKMNNKTSLQEPSKIEPQLSNPSQSKESVSREIKHTPKQPQMKKKENYLSTPSSVAPVKRKPGRPPKSLQATPSTSKFTGFSLSLTSRTYRKMMSRSELIETYSDSDDDEPEGLDPQRKKKVVPLKPCPLCKEKFSASLILHRHIQLVHKRRSILNAKKVESPDSSVSIKKMTKYASNSSGDDFKVFKKSSPKLALSSGSEESKSALAIDSTPLLKVGKGKIGLRKLNSPIVSRKNDHFQVSKKTTSRPSAGETSLVDSKGFKRNNKSEITDDDKITKSDLSKEIITIIDEETPLINIVKSFSFKVNPGDSKIPVNKDFTMTAGVKKKFQKNASLSAVDSNSDTDSFTSVKNIATGAKNLKHLRKARSSSTFVHKLTLSDKQPNLADAKVVRGSKRYAPSSTADENSDVDSVKSLGKTNPSSIIKGVKRLKAQLSVDSHSDSDSMKNSKVCSPSAVQRIVSPYSSDSESVKKFRKSCARLQSSSSPGTDLHKKTRCTKVIAIDMSDEDSDISIIAVTPATGFYVCTVCKANFSRSFHLQRHMRMEHSSNSTTAHSVVELSKQSKVCSICKEEFATKVSLNQHMKTMHDSKSETGFSKSSLLKKISVKSLSLKKRGRPMKMVDAASRSALSRQCRKPLPPLKRKWSKKDSSS